MDTQDVGAELRRLAKNDPLGPIDGTALLHRGRAARRRRRMLSAGGGVVAVAAVATAASLLPKVVATDPEAGVAGTNTPVARVDFTAVPGVPRGEAGVGAKLTEAEVARRCALRYPQIKRPIRTPSFAYSSATVFYQPQKGSPDAKCTIPGGDKPSAELVAAAGRDPMPTTDAGRLRNCSVLFWTDMTRWRIVASDTAPARATNLVAVSPSGAKFVDCTLVPRPDGTATPDGSGPMVFASAVYAREAFDDKFAQFSVLGGQACSECKSTYFSGFGRLSSAAIARIRVAPAGSGNVHDIAVRDGYYALSWIDPDLREVGPVTLTAYDKTGNVLKVIHG
ncbi:hypothetical protein E0H75_02150 [Kribbella capetownensis]|uniref:Uncharacterized protein n=1 Tax=Kribbella capetownensis TaxID=1572659 RepID=A0A4R0K3Z7_9ACTN|nr:hypothetical protein [Kribbella capetownensis]TCC52586.1 hypothetical protein E0H75_02150 [Kribbella capetownensis]